MVCFWSNVPPECFEFEFRLPTTGQVDTIINAKRRSLGGSLPQVSTTENSYEKLIVSRSLGVPVNWTFIVGATDNVLAIKIKDLLQFEPDEFITPAIAIYYLVESEQDAIMKVDNPPRK